MSDMEKQTRRKRRRESAVVHAENGKAGGGSQAFCGLARLEWWDLAGCGPLASPLKLERERERKKITVKK